MVLNYNLKNNAFSLLELIIAVAILSIGIIIVLEALSYSTRMAGLSCDIIDAVLLAEDKMQELEFKEEQNLTNKESGEIIGKKEGFDWKYTLNLEPDLNLYKLSFNIKWLRANREEGLDLNTYLR